MSPSATIFMYTESPSHAGTGQGLDAIDMPIQREVTTSYPIIQGSGVKGALREQYGGTFDDKQVVFGPEANPDFAGAASFGDARLIAFPVRSARGVMAWATSQDLLARFVRDTNGTLTPPRVPQQQVPTAHAFASSGAVVADTQVLLEEYLYTAVLQSNNGQPAYDWADWLAENALPTSKVYTDYYKQAFKERFIILPDDDLRDFALYATEVITRVRIDNSTKTVVDGALFTQELLPADTLLYVPIQTQQAFVQSYTGTFFAQDSSGSKVLDWLKQELGERIQIGGDETVGHGQVALRWGGA